MANLNISLGSNYTHDCSKLFLKNATSVVIFEYLKLFKKNLIDSNKEKKFLFLCSADGPNKWN